MVEIQQTNTPIPTNLSQPLPVESVAASETTPAVITPDKPKTSKLLILASTVLLLAALGVLGYLKYPEIQKLWNPQETEITDSEAITTQENVPTATPNIEANVAASQIIELPPAAEDESQVPLLYVDVFRAHKIQVTDENGKEAFYNEGEESMAFGELGEITIHNLTANDYDHWFLIVPPNNPYTLSILDAKDLGGEVSIIYGYNTTPDQKLLEVKYIDLSKEQLIGSTLQFTETGFSYLQLSSGEVLTPSFIVTGDMLLDDVPPTISADVKPTGESKALVTLTTEDESGVKILLYSFDGRTFQEYSAPFEVDTTITKELHVFADDNAGNRGARPTDVIKLAE